MRMQGRLRLLVDNLCEKIIGYSVTVQTPSYLYSYNTCRSIQPPSRIQTKPKRNHLPHTLTLLCRPDLQCSCTCAAFRYIGTLECAKLLRNVQWVGVPAFAIANVVLRCERDQLCKVASACTRRRTHGHRVKGRRMRLKRESALA